MSFRFLAVSFLLSFGFAGPATANVNDEYAKTRQYFVDSDYASAVAAATKLLRSQDLSQARRADIFTMRGVSHNYLGQPAKGLEDLNKAIELAAKNFQGEIHNERYYSYYALGKMDAAYQDMLFVAQNDPVTARYFTLQDVYNTTKYLKKYNRGNDIYNLLIALHESGYKGPHPLKASDFIYIDLARELVVRNELAKAEKVIADFTQYDQLLNIRIDRAFEPLWSRASVSRLLDINDFPKRQLAYSQGMLEKYPKSWHAVFNVVHSLRLNDRNAEAEALARSALGKPYSYEFDQNYILWLKNELTYTLSALGRFEEANSFLQPLMKREISEDPDVVNQISNYSEILLEQGDFEKAALVASKAKGHVSGYGNGGLQFVIACSKYRRGQIEEANAIADVMLQDSEMKMGTVVKALLCLQRTDDVANVAIERLKDPVTRIRMLNMLQECRVNPSAPPFSDYFEVEMAKVRLRPDLQAALKPLGVILMTPLTCGL